MAGYSGTSLARRLGVRPGASLALLGARDGFSIDELPPGRRRPPPDTAAVRRDRVVPHPAGGSGAPLPAADARARGRRRPVGGMAQAGVGGQRRNTEGVVREVALPTGMVDNKVCPIDDTCSGLRLVLRKEFRAGRTAAAG
jgi:hypothetical protein